MTSAANPAEDFIDEEFPARYRPLIPPALRRAYGAVDQIIERTEWLDTPSGRCQRGQLIVKAAEFQFARLVETGGLPFEPSWEDYAAPTGKHLVMRSGRARITINQVAEPELKPRRAAFRVNYGLDNHRSLFPEWDEEARKDDARRHILLLHGHQVLTFANLSLPHATRPKLLHSTDNLMALLHDVSGVSESDERPGEEGPATSPDPEALEDLAKFIRDNGLG